MGISEGKVALYTVAAGAGGSSGTWLWLHLTSCERAGAVPMCRVRCLQRSPGALSQTLRRPHSLRDPAPTLPPASRHRPRHRAASVPRDLSSPLTSNPQPSAAPPGIDPATALPVCVDVGTNNEVLLRDPAYKGLRQRRAGREEYDAFMGEVMGAFKAWLPHVMLQFEVRGFGVCGDGKGCVRRLQRQGRA